MPIGVPKVPFQNPGEDSSNWIDVWCDLSETLGHYEIFPFSTPIEISFVSPKKD